MALVLRGATLTWDTWWRVLWWGVRSWWGMVTNPASDPIARAVMGLLMLPLALLYTKLALTVSLIAGLIILLMLLAGATALGTWLYGIIQLSGL